MKQLCLVAPFARGGATDLVTRIYAEALAGFLGISVAVENEPERAARAARRVSRGPRRDAGTLVIGTSSTHGICSAVFRDVPYDWAHDFTPIAPLVLAPNVMIVPPQGGIGSVADLVSAAPGMET